MQVAARKLSNTTMLTGIVVVLVMVVSTHLVLGQFRREEAHEVQAQQENALRLFWKLLHTKGGDFRIDGGNLLVGNYRLDGDNSLPDLIKEATGSSATVFRGDTRVATNILQEGGARALGTRLSGPAYDAIFRKGVPFRGESRILGTIYFSAYDPIRDASGRIIGAIFVGNRQADTLVAFYKVSALLWTLNGTTACIFIGLAFLLLTERKGTEELMQSQLRFLQEIIDAIPAPIFYKDAAGRFLGCNKVYESYLGLTRQELLGKTVHDLWDREMADIYREKDQELMERSGIQVYEFCAKYADGTRHDVIIHKALFRDGDGGTGGLVGVLLDITERKAAEEEARNAYQRVSDILEFLPDPTFVVDRQRHVIAWNRAIEEITGVPKEEILGQGEQACALAFYGEPRKVLIDLLDAEPGECDDYLDLTRSGNTVCAEGIGRMRGEERHIWSIAAPLFDRQGNRVGGIQTLRDVTEQRRAERERNALETQLQLSGVLETLMVRLGHDLKTPLTPLFALLPLVRGKVADPKLQQMLDICQNCAGQIQGLTVKALDLVRLSARQGRPELVPLPLSGVAQRALDGSAGLFSRRGVTCLNGIAPGLLVQGAEEQLALLFDNLLSNAARFAAERGTVRLTASRQEERVLVAVQDDGVGLAPGHQKLIFGEFFKADQARHDLGTQGLGLAISRSIVLNHGGSIWAESPGRDRGTTIFFTLHPAQAA